MWTIETTSTITPDHTITVTLPDDVPPGSYRVVVVLDPASPAPRHDEKPFPYNLTAHDVGPWPEGFTASREQLYGDDGR